jgi:hypothetical protein
MIEPINRNVKNWDWKAQTVWEEDNKTAIWVILNGIESWFYQTRKIKLNIEVYNLRSDSFDCWNLFDFLTHYRLVESAKLKYPVIINSEGQVIDGRHRICKAILKGIKEVDAVQILDSRVI